MPAPAGEGRAEALEHVGSDRNGYAAHRLRAPALFGGRNIITRRRSGWTSATVSAAIWEKRAPVAAISKTSRPKSPSNSTAKTASMTARTSGSERIWRRASTVSGSALVPILISPRELSNVFEWDMHLPLAAAAGVPIAALAILETGEPSPDDLRRDLALARTIAHELTGQHRLSDETYSDGTPGVGRADDGGTAHVGRVLRYDLLADERGAHTRPGDLS